MLVAALALLVQAPVTPPEEDIVVLGRKLRSIAVVTKPDRRTGKMVCRVKRSSGYPTLDAEVCTIALDCSRESEAARIRACAAPRMDAFVARYIGGKREVRIDPGAR